MSGFEASPETQTACPSGEFTCPACPALDGHLTDPVDLIIAGNDDIIYYTVVDSDRIYGINDNIVYIKRPAST